MAQQTLDNLDSLLIQRNKLNNNAGDALSQGETSDQAMASNVDFAAGKGVQFEGGDVLDDYVRKGSTQITLSPATSGTITADVSFDDLGFSKIGGAVTVTGSIRISAVSSPVGSSLEISPLPFAIASSAAGTSSSLGTTAVLFNGGDFTAIPCRAFELGTSMTVILDVSILASGNRIDFSFSYFTDA